MQETVIAVARKIPEFKTDPPRGSFSAWLMRLTRWRIADQLRKREVGQASRLSRAGGTPALPSEGTGMTDVVDCIADPSGMALDSVWQEEWERV